MEILGEKGIGKILKIFLKVCFWGGIAVLIILPFLFSNVNTFLKLFYIQME